MIPAVARRETRNASTGASGLKTKAAFLAGASTAFILLLQGMQLPVIDYREAPTSAGGAHGLPVSVYSAPGKTFVSAGGGGPGDWRALPYWSTFGTAEGADFTICEEAVGLPFRFLRGTVRLSPGRDSPVEVRNALGVGMGRRIVTDGGLHTDDMADVPARLYPYGVLVWGLLANMVLIGTPLWMVFWVSLKLWHRSHPPVKS